MCYNIEQLVIYLESVVNKKEDIKKLLTLFIEGSFCRTCILFIRENHSINYTRECMVGEHLEKTNYQPLRLLEHFVINNEGLCEGISNKFVKKSMLIPLTIQENQIGVVVLLNRDKNFEELIIKEITPVLSILQMAVEKKKILNDYKKIYSESNFFSQDLFLANISHEIRTPLNGVIGYNQLLMQSNPTQSQKNYINSMNQCSIQLLAIINDIIDFSKLIHGSMKINYECCAIMDVIEMVRETLGNRILEKKQNFRINISPKLSSYVVVDKQKLSQIIINLISNSNKYSHIGAEIILSVSQYEEEDKLLVSVKDNGAGISDQDQCKLFNTFIQIENSLTKTGSGLGLAISKKLAEIMGGKIWVSSTPGIGSKFEFTAKYKPYDEYERAIEKDIETLKDKYVLVVDDNADNRILLSEQLLEWKMEPVVCASAMEALRMVINNRYNFALCLIDICMPQMSGVELAKSIKEEKAFLPLVALSSIDSFVQGFDFEYKLEKPIEKLRLLEILIKILESSSNNSVHLNKSIGSEAEICTKSDTPPDSIKILVADDIHYNRNVITNMLDMIGYTNNIAVDDGNKAVEKIMESSESPYHVLLLDLRMPNMDGYDVIKKMNLLNSKVKIVVITASVLENDKKKCREAGVEYFITKPIKMADLKQVLSEIKTKLI